MCMCLGWMKEFLSILSKCFNEILSFVYYNESCVSGEQN